MRMYEMLATIDTRTDRLAYLSENAKLTPHPILCMTV
jgi:hypothetical protein